MIEPILAGYFAKRQVLRPADWRAAPHVVEICSVTGCVQNAPSGWMEHWLHNALWLYDSETLARRMASDDPAYLTHAYRVCPVVFDKGDSRALALPPLAVEPLPAAFRSLGFDAAGLDENLCFDHSPLFCNGLAKDAAVNSACLVESQDEALALALRFSIEQPEPGRYVAVEVLRRS